MRNLDVLKTVFSIICFLHEIEKRLERPIDNTKNLLRYTSLQKCVVLIFFASMIVTFIGQKLLLLKIVLSDIVQSYVVKVICVSAHLCDCLVCFFGKAFECVCLRCVHFVLTTFLNFNIFILYCKV